MTWVLVVIMLDTSFTIDNFTSDRSCEIARQITANQIGNRGYTFCVPRS